MELKDRIKFIIENNKIKPNISEYEFAKSLKTNVNKFAEIRSGKVKSLSPALALEISKQYGFEFLWILTGEGDIFSDSSKFIDSTFNIPVRGYVEASLGYGVSVYDERQTATYGISKKLASDLGISPSTSEIIFARGDSMEPTILGGDSILIDLSKKDILDGVIYCIRLDGQLLIKRLQRLSHDTVGIVSDNPKYKLREVSLINNVDDFAIIGEVRWWGRIAR